MKMNCQTEQRLFKDYQDELTAYFKAVRALTELPGSVIPTDSRGLHEHVDLAHRKVGQAKEDLDRHRAEHGCGSTAEMP
jgi:hypothetical protein